MGLANLMDSAGGMSAPALSGNTPWANAFAQEVRELVRRQAARAPRSLQVHIGPSELGVACDRQVVGKLVGEPVTNHVSDPWPSIIGTAVHAWLAAAFTADDPQRWMAEHRVTPMPGHEGTTDLYDRRTQSVLDHKVLGDSSLNKVRRQPSLKYEIQLYLYALGCLRQGLPVQRVVLIAYPRTRSRLDDLYVWEHAFDAHAVQLIAETLANTERRKYQANQVLRGGLPISGVPRTPSHDECFFCPFYRPGVAHNALEQGCPGTVQGGGE